MCSADVAIELEIEPRSNSDCIGGPVVGITNPSVLLEYRQIVPETADPFPEWLFLADIDVNKSFDQTLGINVDSTLPPGVQFRLLQLEHGGGGCNCWRVERMEVAVNSSVLELEFIEGNERDIECSRVGSSPYKSFCGHLASEARGFITTVIYLNGTMGDCPGDIYSNTTLISAKEAPVSTDCTDQLPQM